MSMIPSKGTHAYILGLKIYKQGPLAFDDAKASTPTKNFSILLESCIDRGWLLVDQHRQIVLTMPARRYFEQCSIPTSVPEDGIRATGSQFNLMTRKPYSPPKRAMRQDIPDWSIRPADFSYKTALGAKTVEP